VQHTHNKVASVRGQKEVAPLISAERGNLITVVTNMNTAGIRSNINRAAEKKYESGAYGWSIDGLNFGLSSKLLDSDEHIY
jgi:hypothetical protein